MESASTEEKADRKLSPKSEICSTSLQGLSRTTPTGCSCCNGRAVDVSRPVSFYPRTRALISTHGLSSAATDVYKRPHTHTHTHTHIRTHTHRHTHPSLIHIPEPTRLGMISSAVFCLKKKTRRTPFDCLGKLTRARMALVYRFGVVHFFPLPF